MPKIIEYSDELTHYGRLGMKWGQHIFTYSDPKGGIRSGSGKKINSKDSRTLHGKQEKQEESKQAGVRRKKRITGNGKSIYKRGEGIIGDITYHPANSSMSGAGFTYFNAAAYGETIEQYADQEVLDMMKRLEELYESGELDAFLDKWNAMKIPVSFDAVFTSAVVLNGFENYMKAKYNAKPTDKKYFDSVSKALNDPLCPFDAYFVDYAYSTRMEFGNFLSEYDEAFKKLGG